MSWVECVLENVRCDIHFFDFLHPLHSSLVISPSCLSYFEDNPSAWPTTHSALPPPPFPSLSLNEPLPSVRFSHTNGPVATTLVAHKTLASTALHLHNRAKRGVEGNFIQ